MKISEFALTLAVIVFCSGLILYIYEVSVEAAQEPPPTSRSNGAFDETTAPAFAQAEAELKKGLVGDELADETSLDD